MQSCDRCNNAVTVWLHSSAGKILSYRRHHRKSNCEGHLLECAVRLECIMISSGIRLFLKCTAWLGSHSDRAHSINLKSMAIRKLTENPQTKLLYTSKTANTLFQPALTLKQVCSSHQLLRSLRSDMKSILHIVTVQTVL